MDESAPSIATDDNFFVSLWNSIFIPGTTPQLIMATHCSFICLFFILSWLIYMTKAQNIHFIMLLLISVLLWGTVIWFINELQSVKLKSNEELFKDEKEEKEEKNNEGEETIDNKKNN
ncbi:Pkr1p SCDLUD_002416 [Saccharomycodes ludwigii]|uniref:Pkr1p n=1 Tax=Saccharomycodes ludwigii TaxID=36035 RepID=UPI001E83FF73|nr:hypothetical protein SCDLUD_002416 [Saccharomycodes ludwigii]KAH3900954.1 hypothetical protein SCDLUD_002416 [Saccharomycodes ludwigii]